MEAAMIAHNSPFKALVTRDATENPKIRPVTWGKSKYPRSNWAGGKSGSAKVITARIKNVATNTAAVFMFSR
jgi:hypothetical protein